MEQGQQADGYKYLRRRRSSVRNTIWLFLDQTYFFNTY